jgi:hypothetical protein
MTNDELSNNEHRSIYRSVQNPATTMSPTSNPVNLSILDIRQFVIRHFFGIRLSTFDILRWS